ERVTVQIVEHIAMFQAASKFLEDKYILTIVGIKGMFIAGSILGAFLGTLALQTLQNVMNLFGVDYFVMIILKGVLILFITYFDTIRTWLRGKA
ncbi:hypothetical protein NE579_16345, partial [Intestinimonas massiliensis]|nr:hypothetical protein [Intestinimonas massiliensis (ex Afouda et al. 2020)]